MGESQTAQRLYWAGHPDLGGILIMASSPQQAVRLVHDDICGCDESDCVLAPLWGITDVEKAIHPFRLRLIPRERNRPPTPVPAEGWRLWWLFDDFTGVFVVAHTLHEALASSSWVDDDITPEVREVRRVDGYDVLVEEAERDG